MLTRRLLLLAAAFLVPACGPGGGGSLAPLGPSGPATGQGYPKGWTGARLLETGAGRAFLPAVAFSAGGVGFSAWCQQFQDVAGARMDLWTSRYVPGAGWEAPQLIEHEDLGHALEPAIAVDALGNAVVVWSQSDSGSSTTHMNVWAARYQAGTGWLPAQLLENDAPTATAASVACDASGNALAAWLQVDSGTFRVNAWASRCPAGGSWSTPELIEADDSGNVGSVAVGMDSSGNGFAAMLHYDGTRVNLEANRYVAGIGWTGVVPIDNTDTGVQEILRFAVSANGAAVAVWSTGGPPFATRFEPGTGWQTPENLQTLSPSSTSYTAVACDAAGGAMAVWAQRNNLTTRDDLWANRFIPGTGWEGPVLIEPASLTSGVFWPSMAMSPSGDALVVWTESDSFVMNVWATRYVVGIGWDAAREIETKDLGSADAVRVAVDSQGRGAAVWAQVDGSAYDIWANRYE